MNMIFDLMIIKDKLVITQILIFFPKSINFKIKLTSSSLSFIHFICYSFKCTLSLDSEGVDPLLQASFEPAQPRSFQLRKSCVVPTLSPRRVKVAKWEWSYQFPIEWIAVDSSIADLRNLFFLSSKCYYWRYNRICRTYS